MHPAFIPTFFATTFLLLIIIFSSEKVEYKLLFVILHSILVHALMVIIFPAGNLGVQQMILGRTRLVFDNVVSHGYGWTVDTILLKIYALFRGVNLQTAFSVLLARMFGVDVYWSHLLLVPLLWGVFAPVMAFMVSKELTGNENISVFSSLIVSLFPTNILWGAVSIPNSLSYLFFFCLVYFLLKYIRSNGTKELLLAITFFFASFLSHYLAGTIALSLFLLAIGVKTYEKGKDNSRLNAKLSLLLAFIFCVSILPFALVYRGLFYPWENTRFSLGKFYERPPTEMALSILIGTYFDFLSRGSYIAPLIFGIASMLGLIGMIYVLRASVKKTPERSVDLRVLFLFLGFLMVVVDDRIVKYFMFDVPFVEFERLWLFRDFFVVPFMALVIAGAIREIRRFLNKLSKNIVSFLRKTSSFFQRPHLVRGADLGTILPYILVFTIMSGWMTASIYVGYPTWAPLQTTSYELEAVKYIEATTNERYIVICDLWMTYPGGMIVGINNPQAYYFSSGEPHGVALFIEMKNNPTNETMKEAMKTNNATTAYFIIEKPRVGTEEYNLIIRKAQQNNVQTYKAFHYEGEEKLRIFYHVKQ